MPFISFFAPTEMLALARYQFWRNPARVGSHSYAALLRRPDRWPSSGHEGAPAYDYLLASFCRLERY